MERKSGSRGPSPGPAAQSRSGSAHDAFVSHSNKDKLAADAVVAHLERAGIRCWSAPRDIVPGASWPKSILQAINGCRVMIVVFSSNANHSDHVRREIERAVNRGVAIIPVRIEEVLPQGDLEYFLSSSHWMDAITAPLEAHLAKLAETIHALLGKPRTEAGLPQRASAGPAQRHPGATRAISGGRSLARRPSGLLTIAGGALLAIGAIVLAVTLPRRSADAGEGLGETQSAGERPASLDATGDGGGERATVAGEASSGDAAVGKAADDARKALDAADADAAAKAIDALRRLRGNAAELPGLDARHRELRQSLERLKGLADQLADASAMAALDSALQEADRSCAESPRSCERAGLEKAREAARQRKAAHEALLAKLVSLEQRARGQLDFDAAAELELETAGLKPDLDAANIAQRVEQLRGNVDERLKELVYAVDSAPRALVALRGMGVLFPRFSAARAEGLRELQAALRSRVEGALSAANGVAALAPLAAELSVELGDSGAAASPAAPIAASWRELRARLVERARDELSSAEDVPGAWRALAELGTCLAPVRPGLFRDELRRVAAQPALDLLRKEVDEIGSILGQDALLEAFSGEPPAELAEELALLRQKLVDAARHEADNEPSPQGRARFAGELAKRAAELPGGPLRDELEKLAREVLASTEAECVALIEEAAELATRGSFEEAGRKLSQVVARGKGTRCWMLARLGQADLARKEGQRYGGSRWVSKHVAAVSVYEEVLRDPSEERTADGVLIQALANYLLWDCCRTLHDYHKRLHDASGTGDSHRRARDYKHKGDFAVRELRTKHPAEKDANGRLFTSLVR